MKETSNNLLVYSRASYLRAAEEQKRRASFNNMQAVLSLHDAVEFCVRAITEEYDVSCGPRDSLMELFRNVDKNFEQQQPVKKLPRSSQIQFLDATRGKVKHHASIPSQQDTDQCFLHATNFLELVSQDYFQTPFEHLSLIALVHDEDQRGLLYKAETYIAEKQYLYALAAAKLAYVKGLPSAELFLGPQDYRGPFGGSSFFHPNVSIRATSGSLGRGSLQDIHVDASSVARAIQEAVNRGENATAAVREKVSSLEKALVVMMAGGDVLAVKRFEESTPRVHLQYNREPRYSWLKDKKATVQIAQEALEYSTGMLLRWQDMGVFQSKKTQQRIYSYDDWEQIEIPNDALTPPAEA